MVYKQVHIFSGNAVDSKNTSFTLRGAPFVDRFKIMSITLPLAYLTTDASNNKVVIERDGTLKTVTIPPASYNATTFPVALETALNAVSTNNFTVTYSELGRNLTIAGENPFTIHPFQRGTTAYRQLGMGKFSPSVTGTSIALGICDFTNTAPLLLTSSTLVSKDLTFVGEENVNVLAMIDVSSPPNAVATWTNKGSWVTCGADVANIDFRFLNASTLLPIELQQPFAVTVGILTDQDDPVTIQ